MIGIVFIVAGIGTVYISTKTNVFSDTINDGTLDTYEAYEYMKYGNGKYSIFLTNGGEIHLTKKNYKNITIETERK